MLKNKYIGVVGLLVGIVGLSVAGFVIWHNHGQKLVSLGSAAADVGTASDQATNNVIPLNQTTPAQDNSGGLSVSSSNSATSMGQLNGNQNSSGGGSSGSNGSSSSSSNSQPLDPSTFAQYDKYKPNTDALFGDIKVGTGTELTANHKAAVYYKGWLTNGTLFDESKPGSGGNLTPFVLTLGAHQVIAGWEEGLSGMKVGGTRLIIVPPKVGYGDAGQGSIPGGAVLVFEVQLLEVQ